MDHAGRRGRACRARGIEVHECDLKVILPFADQTFDLVHANQVIEHVPDVDLFISEIFRVLKPGGRAIISTENGSSWHNIGAAVLGWQIFSLTNVSNRAAGLGNPLSLMRGGAVPFASWTHEVIFNYRGLTEFLTVHGFGRAREAIGLGERALPVPLPRSYLEGVEEDLIETLRRKLAIPVQIEIEE